MRQYLMALSLLCVSGMASVAAPTGKSAANHIAGDYVEARTASVFAGACHYNGELTTTGREAEMVWHIREGVWNGSALNGLSAVASVVSEANLIDEQAERRSILYVDASATPAQAEALTDALKTKYARSLGKVVDVKRVPITFARKNEAFAVDAKGVTKLNVEAMPNRECCTLPHLVWYKPLVELKDRRVGFTRTSGIADKTLGSAWEKKDQNTAFYGSFTL